MSCEVLVLEATQIMAKNPGEDCGVHKQLPVWELIDRAREGHGSPVVDVVAPLAGLLVLRWAAFIEAEQEAIASFNEIAFSPVLSASLRQSAWEHPENLSAHLIDALADLGSRKDIPFLKYASVVASTVRESARRDPDLLRLLVSCVAGFRFETAAGRDAAATAFDDLLARVVEAQGRFGGEFTTPQNVVDLMVKLADPQPGDRVYDPCFGVGGLLVTSARRLRAAAMTDPAKRWNDVRSNGIFGVEISSASFAIGLCRIVLAGIEQPGLELGDALERPLPRNRAGEGFDCIVAAPPWGGKVAATKVRQYPVSTGGIENLFLQHVMANLKPGGRAVIALPEGTLFRTGADRQVRKTLLSEFRVDAVVSLPAGSFAPCTGISSSLVIFRREPPGPEIRFLRIDPVAWPRMRGEAFRDGEGNYGTATPAGNGFGDGRAHTRIEAPRVLWEVPAIVRKQRQPSSQGGDFVGLEVWDAPVKGLASRDFELIAKRSGMDLLKTTLERLQAADPELKVVPLEQVADVAQGVSYERKLTTEHRNGHELAPLVRVGDVVARHVKRPTLFLTKDAAARVRDSHRLRRGDLLITTSGTVGKIGVVDESISDAVATKSLVVIRPRQSVAPNFLAAILRAPEYQDWLLGHARGSTIQHLSVRTLRKLPVPVPLFPEQDAVLRNLTKGGDALALLLRQVAGGTSEPIAAWLERPIVVSLLSEKTMSAEPSIFLSQIGRELWELHSVSWRIARQSTAPESIIRWLALMGEYGRVVAGIDAVPLGTARLAVLELAKRHLENARAELAADESPLSARVRLVTAGLVRLQDQAGSAMLGEVAVKFRAEPSEVVVGLPTEIRLQVRNESVSGLRDVRVATRPEVGGGEIPYLAEGTSAELPLTVVTTSSTQPLQLNVQWSALRLDGTPAHGENTVVVIVRSTREVVRSADLGASPYIVGNPIDREEMFFGRADVIRRIRRQLAATTNANIVLLEGNRRTGKTSILKQLQRKDTLPGWLIAYCNFQEAEGDSTRAGISTRDVYRFLARTIGWTLFGAGIRTWFPGQPPADGKQPFPSEFLAARDLSITNDHPFEMFELYLRAALEAARPQRVLLMLDEFDKLQEGIDTGVTSPQVPENIRHILQHNQGFSAILTGSRRLKRLREEYWSALFGLGYRLGISSIPIDDAQRLVTEPVAGRLNYLPQARDHVVALCSAQPFLVQSLCNRIFERAASTGERAITVAAVDAAAAEMVSENEHFRTLWDYARTYRRRMLLVLCERHAEGPDAITLDFLSAQIEAAGVHIPRQTQLGDDLDYLRELELVEFDKSYRGGSYRIAVPLLGLWIRTSIDFDDAAARAREEALEEHP